MFPQAAAFIGKNLDSRLDLSVIIGNNRGMRINGSALKAIRERSGLSQVALADKAGITQGRISEFESGSPNVRPATAQALAEALVVPTTALLQAPAEVAS